MNLSGLDLNLLIAMDALLAEKNVSRAGERIHLSQSATSGALARLREAFHDPLLVNVGRKMELTPLAELLVKPVREFLLRAETIVNMSPVFDPEVSTRKFRIVLSDYVETVVMTEAVPRIEQVAPGVIVELVPNNETLLGSLERGEVDLAILPTKFVSPDYPSEPLFDDEFTCIAWSGNQKVHHNMSLKTYLSLGHVVVRFGRLREVLSVDELSVQRFLHERKIEVIATAFNLVPQLIIGTSRIATLQRRLAVFYANCLPLKLIRPPVEIPRMEESMQWHQSRDRDPGTIWLRSMLKNAVEASAARVQALSSAAKSQSPSASHKATKP